MDSQESCLPPSPEPNAGLISKIFLLWIIPFLKRGTRKGLNLEDVYHSLPEHSSGNLGSIMESKWNEELKLANLNGRLPKLWRVIVRLIWRRYALIGLGYAFDDILLISFQPLVLRSFIKTFSVEDPGNNPNHFMEQFTYASALIMVTFFHAVFRQNLIGYIDSLGIQIRNGVSSLIYRKVLRICKSNSEQANVGKLCNLLSTDVDRIDKNFHLFNFFYLGPIQLTIFIYFLWNELGIASLGGVACIVLIFPLQVLIGRSSMYFRLRIGKRTDERGRFVNEIIGGIRLIKMYAWEMPFASVISKLRRAEINFIRNSLYMRGMFVSVHAIGSKLIPFCALILYATIMGNKLSAEKVFFSIAIFNLISQAILHRIPTAASQLGDLLGSLKRVESFMLSKDDSKKGNKICEEDEDMTQKPGNSAIVMKNFSASWTENQQTLKNLTVDLQGNKLVIVVGHVGSGKSSFLNAILSELSITSTDSRSSAEASYCDVQGQISYASQEPWIFPASLRQNILFGLDMDEKRYWKVIDLCFLSDDLKQFPHGDLELVGERGVALSGGQKARVNLARCLYQEADIYLLDDILSAVDNKVGKKLFNECIKARLDQKLRILVTHQLQYLPMADHIIVLNREGSIWGQGTYDELKRSGIDFSSLIGNNLVNSDSQNSGDVVTNDNGDSNGVKEVSNLNELESFGIRKRLAGNSKPDIGIKPTNKEDTISQIGRKHEERKIVGSAGIGICKQYFKSGGSNFTLICLLLAFIGSNILSNFSDICLSQWTNSVSTVKSDENGNILEIDNQYYVYMYCCLMAGLIIMVISRSIIFFRYCMRVSINLHDGMFKSIVRAPVKFFDDNPSGRIMNRFTKDLNQIDEQLPVSLHDSMNVMLNVLGMLAINISANYSMAVPAIIMMVSLYKLRRFYMRTAEDLKRIEALTKSPIFTHITMTVQGLTTIRALKAQKRVLNQFEKLQDTYTAVYYINTTTSRWLTIWLEIMAASFLAVACYGFLFLTSSAQAGSVGVALSAILSLSGGFQWGMKQSAQTETYMTSVERVLEYCSLKPEAPLECPEDKQLKENWPNEGQLTFQDVSLAYDDDNENKVLKDVTFSINSKEKVGVAGRTGAGKSSLITALFRLTETCNGKITIDDIPIDKVGLHTLRSRISIIPQDPVLFTGTLRYNLDPFDEFTDDQLRNVLREVDLHHTVQNLEGPVSDGGSNFSVGQRQLICLGRAILRKNRILVLDEPTANVDPATDNLVQQTIRRKFSDCTILTIAHRLQTVMDNDRIMVLDVGKVVEFDSPEILMGKEHGALRELSNLRSSN